MTGILTTTSEIMLTFSPFNGQITLSFNPEEYDDRETELVFETDSRNYQILLEELKKQGRLQWDLDTFPKTDRFESLEEFKQNPHNDSMRMKLGVGARGWNIDYTPEKDSHILICGSSSSGKTNIAQNIALHIAQDEKASMHIFTRDAKEWSFIESSLTRYDSIEDNFEDIEATLKRLIINVRSLRREKSIEVNLPPIKRNHLKFLIIDDIEDSHEFLAQIEYLLEKGPEVGLYVILTEHGLRNYSNFINLTPTKIIQGSLDNWDKELFSKTFGARMLLLSERGRGIIKKPREDAQFFQASFIPYDLKQSF